jgi:hypothetical protein
MPSSGLNETCDKPKINKLAAENICVNREKNLVIVTKLTIGP